jgi:RimJ/RimL family protein N-acetyltransferase
MTAVTLRDVTLDDLPTLYEYQLDPEANRMAAVIPRGREAFMKVWEGILAERKAVAKVILSGGRVVGSISCFDAGGWTSVGYWIAREHWGRGVASRALGLLLDEVVQRPLHARVARHNPASLRVLQKHGFRIIRYEDSPGTERYLPCEEAILILE